MRLTLRKRQSPSNTPSPKCVTKTGISFWFRKTAPSTTPAGGHFRWWPGWSKSCWSQKRSRRKTAEGAVRATARSSRGTSLWMKWASCTDPTMSARTSGQFYPMLVCVRFAFTISGIPTPRCLCGKSRINTVFLRGSMIYAMLIFVVVLTYGWRYVTLSLETICWEVDSGKPSAANCARLSLPLFTGGYSVG